MNGILIIGNRKIDVDINKHPESFIDDSGTTIWNPIKLTFNDDLNKFDTLIIWITQFENCRYIKKYKISLIIENIKYYLIESKIVEVHREFKFITIQPQEIFN